MPFNGPGATWTYGQLVHDIHRLAAGLQRRGLEPGDRVMILADNSPDVVRAWAAVTLVGAVAVSLNARSTVDELRWYGSHAAPVAAIVQRDLAGAAAEAMPDLRWLAISDGVAGRGRSAGGDALDALLADEGGVQRPPLDPGRPASVQYTSGTTARPKAVLWTQPTACGRGGSVPGTRRFGRMTST